MIVLGIIAILVALAYPSYIDYVRKARRGEAQQLLMNWSINQEIWRSNNPEYATTAELPVPTHDHFLFTLPDRTATTFNLQADAQDDQVNDKAKDGSSCATMNLNSLGQKLSAVCWGATPGGS
jgi:type IV pilus assembly protein PilE